MKYFRFFRIGKLSAFGAPVCVHTSVFLVSAVVLSLAAACAAAPELPDPLAAGWKGAPVCERLHEDPDQRILRCRFEPGVGHERHYHAPHFGYALSGGRMRITDESGTREVDLPAGTSFSSAGVEWHEVLNVGETTTEYLIFEIKKRKSRQD